MDAQLIAGRILRAGQWMAAQKWKLERHERLSGSGREALHVKLSDATKQADRELLCPCLAALYAGGDEPAETDIQVEGSVYPGQWKLRRAWWEREDPRQAGDNLLTLHKYYVLDDGGDTETFYSEDNCTWRVSLEFHWDESAVADVPKGSSGITYAVRNASRDEETGLWDYIVERREHITTTTGIVETGCDAFREIWQQGFYGVREGMLDHTGQKPALWEVHEQPQGTLVEVIFIQKNDDCTTDIIQRKTLAKAAQARVDRELTAFADTLRVTLRNQPEAVDAAVEVAGGIVTARQSELNPDGTYDNTQTERTAVGGVGAVSAYETAFQTGVSITLRNQPEAMAASVVVSGGVITRRQARQNDDGTWDNEETLTTAVPGTGAVSAYATAFQTGAAVTLRNQPEAAAAAVEVAGGVITRRQARQNDDGTWDNEETLTTAVAADSAAVETHETIYERTVSVTNRNRPAAVAEAVTAANGLITRRTARQNDDGTWDNTETVTLELPVQSAVIDKSSIKSGGTEAVTHRNQAEAAPDPSIEGRRVRNERTPGGLWNQTLTDQTPPTADGVLEMREKEIRALETATAERRVRRTAGLAEDTAQTTGTVRRTRNELDDANGWTTTENIETATPKMMVFTVADLYGAFTLTRYFNYTAAQEQGLLNALSGTQHNSVSPGQVNRFNLFDGVIVSRPAGGNGAGGGTLSAYEENGLTREETALLERGGETIVRTTRYTYDIKQDWGISSGALLYSGALSGSRFRVIADDWYCYERVSLIEVSETAVELGESMTAVAGGGEG
jgi:hypothetical protein